MPKKKYFLFAGWDYYPSGGLEDLMGSFDSPEEAKGEARAKYDWAEIATIDENGELVRAQFRGTLGKWVND